MMNKKICKAIAVLLIIALLLPSGVYAIGHTEVFALDYVEYAPAETPAIEEVEPDNVYDDKEYELEYMKYMFNQLNAVDIDLATAFNIHYAPGEDMPVIFSA